MTIFYYTNMWFTNIYYSGILQGLLGVQVTFKYEYVLKENDSTVGDAYVITLQFINSE